MNTKSLLITVLAIAFVGAASATSKTPAELQQEAQSRMTSTLTRAQVLADLAAWQAAGETVFSGDEWVRRDHFVSTLSRDEVLAEAAASRARGDYVRVGDEVLPRHVARQTHGLGREEVAPLRAAAVQRPASAR